MAASDDQEADARPRTMLPSAPGLDIRPTSANGTDEANDPGDQPGTEAFTRAVLDTLDSSLVVLDGVGRILAVNAAWEASARANGATRAGVGADYFAVCETAEDPTAAQTLGGLWAIASDAATSFTLEYPSPTPDAVRWFRLTASRYVGTGPARIVIRHDEITAEKLARDASHLRAQLLDAVDAAVVATDLHGTVEVWNGAAERLYGWSSADAVGRDVAELIVPADQRSRTRAQLSSIIDGEGWEGEFDLVRRDGSTLAAYVRDRVVRDEHGSPRGIVGVAVDLSERIAMERELARNNASLQAVTERMGDGLCTLDADGRISYVNPQGDCLLGTSEGAAIGGSFVNRLIGTRADGSPRKLSERLIGSEFDGAVPNELTEDQLVRADGSLLPIEYVATALPAERDERRSGWVVVFRDISARIDEQARLRTDAGHARWMGRIQDALEYDRFVLHAQPVVELASGHTVHHELLLRLDDPDEGLIAPNDFLPTAEAFGLAPAIDRWVISRAVAIAARGVPVQVNLSARSLGDPSLPYVIERLIGAAGADPADVMFEITETALMDDNEEAARFAHRIRALGCQLALDDFGTGYGAFTYIKNLPVDVLKIDMAFVADVAVDPASRHVISAVVALAEAFDLTTIAEGVEDEVTLELLRELGVDRAQGYHLGRPASLTLGAGTDPAAAASPSPNAALPTAT
jgi:PAS domain S-box-containing protein